ncbi:unnamed protein product [Heterobilharzia americana]|nr:unnamed protein product [Heterobilharzia americana]
MPNLKGSIENLRRQLRALRFNYEVNFQGMVLGQPSAFVEFYRHLLCDYNAKLTSHLVERGFGMLGTTDNRFMEVFYRILRDVISFRPPVNLTQFFMTDSPNRSLVSREKTGIQNGQHHHRNQLLNHPKPNSTSVFHSELPLVLPGVSYHRSVDELYDGVMHSNERNSMTCGDLPNRNGFTHVKGVRSTENLSICQCPQESYNRCSNQSSVKVTKLSKIEPLCSGNYLRDEYDRMPNYALRSNYDQYKRAYHPLNSNPRVCAYSTLHNNCTRLPDGKYTTPTSKINTLSTMPPTKKSNSVNNTKQFSKDNYSALLTSSSQKY